MSLITKNTKPLISSCTVMFTADPQVDLEIHKEVLKAERHTSEKHRLGKPI